MVRGESLDLFLLDGPRLLLHKVWLLLADLRPPAANWQRRLSEEAVADSTVRPPATQTKPDAPSLSRGSISALDVLPDAFSPSA